MALGFTPPWAIDKNGKKIPTHYEIRENNVVQVVEHLGEDTSYPVVADPWLFIDLISTSVWDKSIPTKPILRVTPTAWARSLAFSSSSYLVGSAGWDELYTKQTGLGVNYSGMRNQYICHQQVVAVVQPTKPTWNLDQWRLDVGYVATVNAQCNPGTAGNIID
jgi:hypothetical protein